MSDARINDLTGRWLINYIRIHAGGISLGTGGAGESGFDPVELWVMGPPCGSKVGRTPTYCTVMVARHGRG